MKVDIKKLSHIYKNRGEEVPALEDVTFTVNEGQLSTIVGTSGCGKTTLLNIIGGHLKQTSGQVLVDGGVIPNPGSDRILVFQEDSLFPWLSVIENIEYGLKIQGMPKKEREEKTKELVERMSLKGFERLYPHELSGGMKQRVNLAQALAVNPKVLLMDEPFRSLDFFTHDRLVRDLEKVFMESGTTIIFVTHDLGEASYLGDKVIVLSDRPGRVIQEVEVDLPRPRFKHESKVADIAEKIRGHLNGENNG